MARVTFWGCLLLSFMLFSVSECCQSILKEGDSASFKCQYNSFTTSMSWQVRTGQTFSTIVNCSFATNKCINSEPRKYTGHIVSSSDTNRTVNLQINDIKRNETEFECEVDKKFPPSPCIVEVYVPPTTPTCDPVTFDSTEKNLEITCRTKNVYPSLKTVLKRRGTVGDAISGTCRNLSGTESPRTDRNPVECTWRILAANMAPGVYIFYVEMYAEVSNFTASGQRVVTSPDISVALRSPSADIDASCTSGAFLKQGFIMVGKEATCKCRLATVGFPPGKAGWYTQDGRSVGTYNPLDSSSTLTVLYNSLEPFNCRAESSLFATDTGTTYSPKIAYTPNVAFVEVADGTSPNLCPGRSPTTTFTCMTPFVASQPKVLFSVFADDGIITKKREGNQTLNFYTYTVVIRHTRGGKSQLTCVVENSLFSELSVSKSLQVEVSEPPSEAPFFIINESRTIVGSTAVIIGEETNVNITCRTHGGYPPVNNVTIICGSEVSVTVGGVGVLMLSASKSMNGVKCICSANHVTDCYQKTSEILLQTEDSKQEMRTKIFAWAGAAAAIAIVLLAISVLSYRGIRKRKAGQSIAVSYSNKTQSCNELTYSTANVTENPYYSKSSSSPCAVPTGVGYCASSEYANLHAGHQFS